MERPSRLHHNTYEYSDETAYPPQCPSPPLRFLLPSNRNGGGYFRSSLGPSNFDGSMTLLPAQSKGRRRTRAKMLSRTCVDGDGTLLKNVIVRDLRERCVVS